MDLQQLKYFLAVVDAGNFSAAARRCGITQPSLSQQMAKLERDLKHPLFDRLPRGVVLTEAGHRLNKHARALVDAARDAEHNVREMSGQIAGKLAIGAIPTIAPYLLPKVLSRFNKRYPQVELLCLEDVTENLLDRLEAGEIDVAIASHPIDRPTLHTELLFEEPLLLCLPARHRLAKRSSLKWRDIASERFMVLHDMHCMGAQVLKFCRGRGRGKDPNIVLRGSQISTIQQLISKGLGLSFIAEMAAEVDRTRQRVYLDLGDETPYRQVNLVWHLHRFRTNAARAFTGMLKSSIR